MLILCNLLHRYVQRKAPLLNAVVLSPKCLQSSIAPSVCLVGSGPSAFYTAQYLLRRHTCLKVDMYEKLPAPFGLVRYGVAPDHPEVKNVLNTFAEVAQNPRFNFVGHVSVGQDLRLHELQRNYSAVVLAYGASQGRKLDIPGENLSGVLSANDFVGWYNGAPGLSELNPNLSSDTVAVLGLGNVSVDVARILLSPIGRLKTTDIPEPVMTKLSESRVRRVIIIGRRGPLQVSFTVKEFRELSRLVVDDVGAEPICIRFLPANVMQTSLGSDDEIQKLLTELPRPRRRLLQLLLDLSRNHPRSGPSGKQCDILFLRSPVCILPNADSPSHVGALELAVNQLTGPVSVEQSVRKCTNIPSERLDCSLVIRSIGYRSVQIDPDLPFDHRRGVILCKDAHGRVPQPENSSSDAALLYCTGWAKGGPVGVIVDTSVVARDTAQTVLVDLATAELESDPRVVGKPGLPGVLELLQQRGVRTVSFSDWQRADAVELSTGKSLGKPREKLTSVADILRAAFADVSHHRESGS